MKFKFYQLPYYYSDEERWYKNKGGVISDNLPAFLFKWDTGDSAQNKPFITRISKLFLNLKFKQEPQQFNYVVIEENNVEKGYFVIGSKKIISKKNYEFNLKLDIILTYDLFKKPTQDTIIDVERYNYQMWEIDNNVLKLKADKNPKIWNNNEFSNLIPYIKKEPNPIKTTFENFAAVILSARTFGGPQAVSMAYQDFISVLNFIIDWNDTNDKSYYNVAVLSENEKFLFVPIMSLSKYGKELVVKNQQQPLTISSTKAWLNTQKTNFKSVNNYNFPDTFIDFIIKIIQAKGQIKNFKQLIIANPNLQTIFSVSSIFPYPETFTADQQKQVFITEIFTGIKINDASNPGFTFDGILLGIKNQKWNWIELENNLNFNKANLISINDKLFKNEEKYLSSPAIFSSNYREFYFSFFGDIFKLNNRKIFTDHIYIKNQYFVDTELIYLFQGDIDNIDNYNNFITISNNTPIAYNKKIGEINYLNRKNYYDARLGQVELNRRSNNRLIQDQTELKIIQNKAAQRSRDTQLIEQTRAQIKFTTDTRGRQQLQQGINFTAGLATAFAPGARGLIRAAGAAAAANQGIGLVFGEQNLQSSLELLKQNRDIALQASQEQTQILNNALIDNQLAVENKILNDYKAQKGLILGEINDLLNLPPQKQNNSDAARLLKPKQKAINWYENTIDDTTKKRLWYYFNKYGNEAYGIWKINDAEWYKKNTFWNYFQGGNWTKYLNRINIFDVEIIDEFNLLMSAGLRLFHRKFDKFKSDNSKITEKNKIDYELPNWGMKIGNELLK